MRRMLSQKFITWLKKVFPFIQQNGNSTEFGGDVYVDGKVDSDVYESASEVGGVKVMLAKFNPTGKKDNHFHITNSTTKLDTSDGESHTIDEIFEGGSGGLKLYVHTITFEVGVGLHFKIVIVSKFNNEIMNLNDLKTFKNDGKDLITKIIDPSSKISIVSAYDGDTNTASYIGLSGSLAQTNLTNFTFIGDVVEEY